MKIRSPALLGRASVTPGEILQEEFLSPLGLSQSELAVRAGIGRMRISQIVRGVRSITAQTAIQLSRPLLDAPADQLRPRPAALQKNWLP
jgi:addiction module HigA family antidote